MSLFDKSKYRIVKYTSGAGTDRYRVEFNLGLFFADWVIQQQYATLEEADIYVKNRLRTYVTEVVKVY